MNNMSQKIKNAAIAGGLGAILAAGSFLAYVNTNRAEEQRKAAIHYVDASKHAPVECGARTFDDAERGTRVGQYVADRRTPGRITTYEIDPMLGVIVNDSIVGIERTLSGSPTARIEQVGSTLYVIDGSAAPSTPSPYGTRDVQMGSHSEEGSLILQTLEHTKRYCTDVTQK